MMNLWNEIIKPIVYPIYETFLEPLYHLYGYWFIALLAGVIITTALVHKGLSKTFTDTRIGKDAIIFLRFMISFIFVLIGTHFILGELSDLTYLLTLTIFINIIAGVVYGGLKFLGIKELTKLIGIKLYKLAKKINLPKVIAKEVGVPKFIVNRAVAIADTHILEYKKGMLKESNKDIDAFTAYLKKEHDINKKVKSLFRGIISEENLDEAVSKFNKSIKERLEANNKK